MLLEKSTLGLRRFQSFLDSLHFRCILEIASFTLFVLILTLLEELASAGLHMPHFICLVDLVAHRHLRKWVRQSKIRVQLKVDELEQSHVELSKRSHDLVVNVERQSLVELVRLDPRDRLSHDLDSEVDALDRQEGLCEALAYSAVEKEVAIETLTGLDLFP